MNTYHEPPFTRGLLLRPNSPFPPDVLLDLNSAYRLSVVRRVSALTQSLSGIGCVRRPSKSHGDFYKGRLPIAERDFVRWGFPSCFPAPALWRRSSNRRSPPFRTIFGDMCATRSLDRLCMDALHDSNPTRSVAERGEPVVCKAMCPALLVGRLRPLLSAPIPSHVPLSPRKACQGTTCQLTSGLESLRMSSRRHSNTTHSCHCLETGYHSTLPRTRFPSQTLVSASSRTLCHCFHLRRANPAISSI